MTAIKTIGDYQTVAHSTSKNTEIENNKVIYPLLGLPDEFGEVLGKIKKLYRDNEGRKNAEWISNLEKEFGDTFWYLQEIATQCEIDLQVVCECKTFDELQNSRMHQKDARFWTLYKEILSFQQHIYYLCQACFEQCTEENANPRQKEVISMCIKSCMFDLARILNSLDLSMQKIAQQNVDKLLDRQSRNKIGGDGDHR